MASNSDEWTPDKPLPNKEDEEEVDGEARARARLDYLRNEYSEKAKAPKKRRGMFRGRD